METTTKLQKAGRAFLLRLVAEYLTGERGVVGNSFDAGIAASLSDENRVLRVEPFALLHQLEE